MKHTTTFSMALLIVIAMVSSCQKQAPDYVEPLVFNSLYSSSSSFPHGESVVLTANATGTNVTYYWSFVEGSISGSGSNVTYTCEYAGTHKVICTVKDSEGNIKDKQLFLYVQ